MTTRDFVRRVAKPRVTRWWHTLGVAIACLIIGAGAAGWWRPRRIHAGPPIIAFSIDLTASESSASGVPVAVAPDGSCVVYGVVHQGRRELAVRRLDRDDEVALAGTYEAQQPAFSPDGREVAFAAGGKLKRTAVSGGIPIVLGDLPDPRGIAWSSDGYIVYAPDPSSGLFRIRSSGGAPEALTRVDRRIDVRSHRWPYVTPEGVLLFVEMHGTPTQAQIVVQSLEKGQQEIVITDGIKAQYMATGHLMYVNSHGEAFMVPFSPPRLAVTGRAVPLLEQPVIGTVGDVSVSVSSGGTLAYVPLGQPGRLMIVVNWRDGLTRRTITR